MSSIRQIFVCFLSDFPSNISISRVERVKEWLTVSLTAFIADETKTGLLIQSAWSASDRGLGSGRIGTQFTGAQTCCLRSSAAGFISDTSNYAYVAKTQPEEGRQSTK
jgi:hypothetical protein